MTDCRYLRQLIDYMEGYMNRVKPLHDLNEDSAKVCNYCSRLFKKSLKKMFIISLGHIVYGPKFIIIW